MMQRGSLYDATRIINDATRITNDATRITNDATRIKIQQRSTLTNLSENYSWEDFFTHLILLNKQYKNNLPCFSGDGFTVAFWDNLGIFGVLEPEGFSI